MLRFFDRYVPRYLARRFHRVHLWGRPSDLAVPSDLPVLFVVSHASWWDVLVGYYLARRVVSIESYAPMDEAQLRRYRLLARLGAYSIDRFSAGGLRAFVRYTTELLKPGRAVWVTPQGEITSAWRRPIVFQTGVGHLIRRAGRLDTIPVAIVYEFLEEPRPEIFVKLGPARRFEAARDTAQAITRRLESDLERELSAVQQALLARDLTPFTALLEGATSVSRVYDPVRRLRARITGRPDPPRHGAVVSDPRRRPG
jgi:1-acyl-sn-glycerol-3-phosphate acyltransferase